MTTGGNMTPPQSPRVGDEPTPSKQKGSSLMIQTSGLDSNKRRNTGETGVASRMRDLQALAAEKQTELEEILLQLNDVKGKATAPGGDSESSSEGSYDSLYEEEEEEEEEQSEKGGMRGDRTKLGVECLVQSRGPNASRPKEGKQQKPQKRGITQSRRSRGPVEEGNADESSPSEEDVTPVRTRDASMLRKMEARWYQMWDDPAQSTLMMAKRALQKISTSPFVPGICEVEPSKKF